ncbi:MAG: bleomycin resistance protein [Opitutae bacterium]|nr:bleomycin resistance protein [Opitutae bacterium]|tara:strand:- start:530 stop:1081 length:552 start_codon:yes stop_codon:yes gene_type:complete
MNSKILHILFILSSNLVFSEISNFSRQTIDLGVVVKDIQKSLKFYKDIIGFSEKEGFNVSGSFPKKVGLTDGTELKIHVLTLGDEESATKLKLMQVKGLKATRLVKQKFIHTIAGFSYLTIFVEDVELIQKNAKKFGYLPVAESPQILPKGFPQDVCLLMLKDPDGNFVEIVGPLTSTLKNAP